MDCAPGSLGRVCGLTGRSCADRGIGRHVAVELRPNWGMRHHVAGSRRDIRHLEVETNNKYGQMSNARRAPLAAPHVHLRCGGHAAFGGMTLRETGEKLGGMDYAAVCVALRRFEKKAQSDKALREMMATLAGMLNV